MEALGFEDQAVELALADHDALRLVLKDLLAVEGDAAAGRGHHLGTYGVLGTAGQAEGDDGAVAILDRDRDTKAVPAEEVLIDHIIRKTARLHEVGADARGEPAVVAQGG